MAKENKKEEEKKTDENVGKTCREIRWDERQKAKKAKEAK